jgi:hypothetical protein
VRAETSGEVFSVDAGTFGRLLAARLQPCRLPADRPTTPAASAHATGSGELP